MWITFYYISTVDISGCDISVIYICFLYYIRHFFRSGQNHNFILCSNFFIVQKRHIFIEYDIFSWFSLWGIFYIFLVYFYSEILLMLSPHTFYFISTLPNKKAIKIIQNLSENFSVISPFYYPNTHFNFQQNHHFTPKQPITILKLHTNQQFSPNLIISLL